MTDDRIAEIARGLTNPERTKILRARCDGEGFKMQRGDARGLHGRGLVWRSFCAHYLTETGLAVRTDLLENDSGK